MSQLAPGTFPTEDSRRSCGALLFRLASVCLSRCRGLFYDEAVADLPTTAILQRSLAEPDDTLAGNAHRALMRPMGRLPIN